MSRTGEVLEDRMNEFPLEVLKPFVLAANHVLERVYYTSWNPEEMRQKWRTRPLSTVLIDGDVNHLFPCVDTVVIATVYLQSLGLNPRFRLVTDKGTIGEFREGLSQHVHVDSWVELDYQGLSYGMNIGSGDLSFVKKIQSTRKNDQKPFYTTRFETHSQTWWRTNVLLLNGDVLAKNPDTSVLHFLKTPHNLVHVPFDLTLNDYFTFKKVDGEPFVLDSNDFRYNRDACQKFAQDWTADFNDYTRERAGSDFPKLVPIQYK